MELCSGGGGGLGVKKFGGTAPHPPVWKTLDYIDSTCNKNQEHTSYASLIYNSKQRETTIEKIRLNTKPNKYKLLCHFETNT